MTFRYFASSTALAQMHRALVLFCLIGWMTPSALTRVGSRALTAPLPGQIASASPLDPLLDRSHGTLPRSLRPLSSS